MEKSQLSEFVEKAKQGDQAAFEELYSISCKRVYFTCISFLGREEDAKDAMQEVYITSYEKLTSLNNAEKFVPWINRIAVNHCKKILMKKAVVFTEIENAADELTEENENFLPEEYITQKEKRKLVMDIMRNTLSDIQYKTVILYYFNGLPVDEIADIMECPPGTVMYRLSVARAKIRDGVDAYENKSGDKLYSVVGLPLLMRLLYEEADSIDVPDMLHDIMEAVMSRLSAGTAGTAESGTAALEAAETAETAESGAAAIVAVIAAGAVFFIKNSGDEEASGRGTGGAQEQTAGSEDGNDHMAQTAEEDGAQGQTSGGENDAQGQALEFSGDWDAVEEAGYPPFWLKYANLGALEEKDLSDLMFYDKFAFGASLEEMLSSYNYFSFDTGYESLYCNSWEEFMECAAINTIGAKKVRNIWCYTSEGNYDGSMTFEIFNLTDSEITIWEFIENGQFFVGDDAYSSNNVFALFGVPYETGNLADNREALAELVEILGKPSAVANCSNSQLSYVDREEGEEFSETVSLGGGSISYNLIYDKGDYILEIPIIELCISSTSVTTKVLPVRYLTRDVYEYRQERYPDSPEIIQDVYNFE